MEIKNSSGQITGVTIIEEEKIIVDNYNKPLLEIINKELINSILNLEEESIVVLYDEYTLTIAEIASLYKMSYSKMNRKIKKLAMKTSKKNGRRNSSYGSTFDENRKENISKSLVGRRTNSNYERTPEIKEKISQGLIEYYKNNPVTEETKLKLSQAWERGCYDKAKMGRGIQGYFQSYKMNERIYFRSLLELNYMILFEESEKVETYSFEPFKIKLDNSHFYTPDCLINNNTLIEIKPKNHLNYENLERFSLEQKNAIEYCQSHNFTFKTLYDEDINFNSSKFKRYLKNNNELIIKYNIEFKKDL